VIDPDPSPTSVQAAIATSARRARVLVGMQSIALLAVVLVSSRAGCGDPAPLADDGPLLAAADAGLDRPDAAAIAAWVDALVANPPPIPCADVAGCRAACEGSSWHRADACVHWADLLRARHGSYAQRDRIGARDVHRKTCALTQDALACTRIALAGGLLQDLDLAPDWLDPERAPLGMLATACAADRRRGALACAAVELLAPASPLAREPRGALCPGDDAGGAGCATRAADVALQACLGDDAEACYLAANDRLPTGAKARDRLSKLCGEEDRPACLYLFALSPRQQPDRQSLLDACSVGDRKDESIASACLARSLIKDPDPRPARFAEFACELGSCQHPRLPRPAPAVLKRSCDAGHVNGCANLVFANRGNPTAWRPIVDELNRRSPPYARRVSPDGEADEVACELGSLDGCAAASRRLGAKDRSRAARLDAFSQRLLEPLATP